MLNSIKLLSTLFKWPYRLKRESNSEFSRKSRSNSEDCATLGTQELAAHRRLTGSKSVVTPKKLDMRDALKKLRLHYRSQDQAQSYQRPFAVDHPLAYAQTNAPSH